MGPRRLIVMSTVLAAMGLAGTPAEPGTPGAVDDGGGMSGTLETTPNPPPVNAFAWPPVVKVGEPTRFTFFSTSPVLWIDVDGQLLQVVPGNEPGVWRTTETAILNPPGTHILLISTSEGDREEPIDGIEGCPPDVASPGVRLFQQAQDVVAVLSASGAISGGEAQSSGSILASGKAQWAAGRFQAGRARQEALLSRSFAAGSGALMEVAIDMSLSLGFLASCATEEVLQTTVAAGVRVDGTSASLLTSFAPFGRSAAVTHVGLSPWVGAFLRPWITPVREDVTGIPYFPPARVQLAAMGTAETPYWKIGGPNVTVLNTTAVVGLADMVIPYPAGTVHTAPELLPPGGVLLGRIWNSTTQETEVVDPILGLPLFMVLPTEPWPWHATYGYHWMAWSSSTTNLWEKLGMSPATYPVYWFNAGANAHWQSDADVETPSHSLK